MLFSGLGSIETAQETLSVGVGALAGSTILLLTVPWAVSIYAGRVDLITTDGKTIGNYKAKQKLSDFATYEDSGVVITDEIKHGALVMLLTTSPYFLIQIPCSYLEIKNETNGSLPENEKYYALVALIFCLAGFVGYMYLQIKASQNDEAKYRRMEKMKEMLMSKKLSMSGVFYDMIEQYLAKKKDSKGTEYASIGAGDEPPKEIMEYLNAVLGPTFTKYDVDGDKTLHETEIAIFFRDFHEDVSEEEIHSLFAKFDTDGNGSISYDEFLKLCFLILSAPHESTTDRGRDDNMKSLIKMANAMTETAMGDGLEHDDVPEEIAQLPPEQQEAAVKKKAFSMLALGTILVLLFSDPMVDVMQEIAVRININPFYVSFVLAPLASNASEVLASSYYASKKTSKTITVSFSALMGAAAMNNTFCLSIFMGLIYFRGLAWQYTSETIAIVLVQAIIYFMCQKDHQTIMDAFKIGAIFPASVVLIATLTALGFD